MSGYSFDTNILVDALAGNARAQDALEQAVAKDGQAWISRMVWIEVLSKGAGEELARTSRFLTAFGIDELDAEIARRAAALRRERPRLRSPDAIILASAQLRGRILVTRNTRDFPAEMPGIRIPYLL